MRVQSTDRHQMDLTDPEQDVREGIRVSAVKYPPPIPMKIMKRELKVQHN